VTFQILGSTVSGDEWHQEGHCGESVPEISSDDDSMHRPSVSERQHASETVLLPCLGKYVLYCTVN